MDQLSYKLGSGLNPQLARKFVNVPGQSVFQYVDAMVYWFTKAIMQNMTLNTTV